ncbi:MAG: cytochrome o ubiquinol oxidase subunit III [Candidatus Saccharibacteria bacterium]
MTNIIKTEDSSKTLLGFWVYLMTDCVLFASLFATYAVLQNNTYGGPSGKQIFDLPNIFIETILLLTSSFTTGLVMLAVKKRNKNTVLLWLAITWVLGALFLSLEISEFRNMVLAGNSWRSSAFLSSFFTLVGTHGLHILAGLLWAGVLAFQVIAKGLSQNLSRRLHLFSLFWHFLDIIWIFIFTIVYLRGTL